MPPLPCGLKEMAVVRWVGETVSLGDLNTDNRSSKSSRTIQYRVKPLSCHPCQKKEINVVPLLQAMPLLLWVRIYTRVRSSLWENIRGGIFL